MADYMPQADGDFNNWIHNFDDFVTANLAKFHLVAGDMTPVHALRLQWDTDYAANNTLQIAAGAGATKKESTKGSLKGAVRTVVNKFAKDKTVADADRAAAGTTVPDTTPTPVGPPTTAPIGRVETTNIREHTVHFADSTTPTSKAKPAGVRGCQIWLKIGTTPPASQSEMHYEATDTKTPQDVHFEVSDVGKTAYYWLRWENTKGETGPWSAMVSATITG